MPSLHNSDTQTMEADLLIHTICLNLNLTGVIPVTPDCETVLLQPRRGLPASEALLLAEPDLKHLFWWYLRCLCCWLRYAREVSQHALAQRSKRFLQMCSCPICCQQTILGADRLQPHALYEMADWLQHRCGEMTC